MDSSRPTRISRYQIVDRIGEGGMGILYLARDPLLDRTVAIKVLSVHNAELRERFAREARSAASLSHPHIVTIFDVGEDHGQPFIAMEYIDGETLAETIRRKAPLLVGRKIQVALELCAGLGYAHQHGIIHRDIKPANIMVTTGGLVKVLDFGLARFTDDSSQAGLTQVGTMLGTPHYMSPEQVEGRTLDQRSDIFSTGLVLYELLSYRKAFTGETMRAVLYRIVHSRPEPLRDVSPSVDPELERIVDRAIAKAPEDRYQSLAQLADDLSRVQEGLRVSAAADQTIKVDRKGSSAGRSAGRVDSTDPSAATPRGRQLLNQDAMTRRRAAQIESYLARALQEYADGQFEAAIEQCELAALLDPHEPRVLDLLHQAHRGVEERRIEAWLNEAREHLSQDALTEAAALIEQSLQLRPDLPDAQQLHRALNERRREQERARDRARAVRAALDRARFNLDQGAPEAALRSANEAAALDPSHSEARELKRQAVEAIEVRNREHELEQRALELVATARQYAAEQRYDRALEILIAFEPSHPFVTAAQVEITAERAAYERRRRDEEEARRRRAAEEEQRRREAERRIRELEEARRRQAEEEHRREAEQRARVALATERKAAARDALRQGRFVEALAALDQARSAAPDDPETRQLSSAIEAARLHHEEEVERHRQVEQHLQEAEVALQTGDLGLALRDVDAALALEPDRGAALDLRAEIRGSIEAQRRQDEARRAAAEVAITRARRMFVGGEYEAAIRQLEEFAPASLVLPVIAELKSELRKILHRREEEEARQAAEAEEVRRAEDEARIRAAAAAAERAQRAAEDARRRAESEDRARRDEEARHRAVEEAARRAAIEEKRQAEARERAGREEDEHRARTEEAKRQARAESEQRANEAACQATAEAKRLADEEPYLREIDSPGGAETVTEYTSPKQERSSDLSFSRAARGVPARRWILPAIVGLAASAALIVWLASPKLGIVPGPTTTEGSKTPPAVAVSSHTITVNAVPWARVRIVAANGTPEPLERTTPFAVSLPAGEYRVDFQNPSFGSGSQTLVVAATAPSTVSLKLPGADVDQIVAAVLGKAE